MIAALSLKSLCEKLVFLLTYLSINLTFIGILSTNIDYI